MEDIVCEICIKDYNSDQVVPRVLGCGHTICSDCVKQIIQTSKCCPKCRQLITQNCEAYPINFSLLGMVESLKNSPTLKTFLKQRIETLKRKYVALETKFTESKLNVEANIALISTGLAKIQELVDTDEDFIDDDEASHTILSLNDQLEDIRNSSVLNCYKLKSSTTLNCRDYQNPSAFLFEIYNRTANGEQIFAVTKIEEEVKFSRISSWGDKLVLHAFSPLVEGPQVKTIWFQELKNSFLAVLDFRAFLEINCSDTGLRQKIIIKTTNSSLVPQFLKFCTGEMGPVYKGASFHCGTTTLNYTKSVLKIELCMVNGVESEGNLEYFSSLGTSVNYMTNDQVVVCSKNGSLQIFQASSTVAYVDVIGKIEEPLNVADKITYGNNRKVFDCGILIYF